MRSRSTHPKANNITPFQSGSKQTQGRNLRPDLWDERYSEKEREMLMLVAQQYGLDPMTGEVMILHGKIYVTASGLQKLAVHDPAYDGCEIELIETDWANNFFVVKARVWKKDCSHPFEDFGDADPSTSRMRGHALFRHAITRARARAMRSAFAIPFCSLEELDDETRWKASNSSNSTKRPKRSQARAEQSKKLVSSESLPAQTASTNTSSEAPKAKAQMPTEQQMTMLDRYLKELQWNEARLTVELQDRFGIDARELLSREQCSQLLDHLSLEKKPQQQPKKTPQKQADQSSKEAEKKTSSQQSVGAGRLAPEVQQSKRNHHSGSKRAQKKGGLPQWTAEEQKGIASDLVERMHNTKTMKELRREWELFQGIRHQLSEEWFAQICEAKELRKSTLSA